MAQFKPYNFDKDIALNAAKQLKQTGTGTNGVKYDAPQTNIYSQPQKNTYSPPQTNTYSQPQTNTFSYSTPTQTAYPEVQTYMQLLDKQNESEKNSPFASSAGLDESLFEGLDGVMSPITRNWFATIRQLQNEQIEKNTQQALRDNYVSQKLSEYYLPDQMARLGLAGQGASEQANIDMLNIYRNAAAKLKQQESEQKMDADKRILEMLMPYYEKAWEENKAKEEEEKAKQEEKAATDASLDFDALLEAASGNLVNGKFTETDYNNLINFLKQNRDALGEGKYGDYTNLLRERGYVTQEEAAQGLLNEYDNQLKQISEANAKNNTLGIFSFNNMTKKEADNQRQKIYEQVKKDIIAGKFTAEQAVKILGKYGKNWTNDIDFRNFS